MITFTKNPTRPTYQAELWTTAGDATTREQVIEVLETVFPNEDLQVDPDTPGHGTWLVALPRWAEEVLHLDDELVLGTSLVRFEVTLP